MRNIGMNASGTNLAKTIAGVIASAEPGAFGAVLRGLLLAVTTVGLRTVEGKAMMNRLAELLEDAAVYAERNRL